ncbi:MAG: putative sugar O-methyltransferase [Holophagaceae bacterium]|nr:putative sugar O-methyltransferase [Holophagaceae bacterium]
MIQDMRKAGTLFQPSPFWEQLIAQQVRQLEEEGIEHFKKTVNLRYFSWDVKWMLAQQFLPLARAWFQAREWNIFFRGAGIDSAGGRKIFGPVMGYLYGIALALMKKFVAMRDPLGLMDSLEEPLTGDPIYIRRDGLRLSQDLCNSVHEFYAATTGLGGEIKGDLEVVELGAGYGRVGFVFLKALKGCRYTVIDIPPTLYVAQEYLSAEFPGIPIFKYRDFSSFDEIRTEFENAQIRFIAAHQIELLPEKHFDLFLNISSLAEMTREQIDFYFAQIDRLTRRFFYTKQWRNSRAPGNGFRVTEFGYPVPKTWTTLFHERHPMQRFFFHALYSLPR